MVLYSENHIWFDPEKNTVGLSELAVKALGGIEHFELCDSGTELHIGESFGSLESAKMVIELISPISGNVIAINPAPSGAEWLIEVEIIKQSAKMMNQEEYNAFVAKYFA